MIVVLNRGFDDGFEDEKIHNYCVFWKLNSVYTSRVQKATLLVSIIIVIMRVLQLPSRYEQWPSLDRESPSSQMLLEKILFL